MRVIICGAGQVGYNIADYLARNENDVTVIDTNPQLIEQINNELDVKALLGHASDPEILAQAGAGETDLIVAVTNIDEVNMVACQVAHSLFNVPKKIARIREQSYLAPAWSNLFSRAHMPIDVIISPELEVARSIGQRLRIPGTTTALPMAGERVFLVGVQCESDCPLINTQIKQIRQTFPDLKMEIASILRAGRPFVPDENDQIQIGDEVFFFTAHEHRERAMAAFGHKEKKAHNIAIVGGGKIGISLVKFLKEEHENVRIRIIERDEERARQVSQELKDVIVLHGEALNSELMREADIAHMETLIAVTGDDENNILTALMAKRYGCDRVIALVNNAAYSLMTNSLGIDATVSPRSSTVSTIMQHVRRGRIKALHTLRDGFAEVIEAEISDMVAMANKELEEINLPAGVMIGMIVRGEDVILPTPEFVIRPNDHVIILAERDQARKIEKMFSVQVDIL